jgi:hypothetical protein
LNEVQKLMTIRFTLGTLVRAAALAALCASAVFAQFNSGSTGADGALNYTTPGTYEFDPAALGLNPAGDNIFHFTTINIGSGVTLRLRASKLRQKPVVWLASGAVTIAGLLDLSGENGHAMDATNPLLNRIPAEPGPGGFPGGLGSLYIYNPSGYVSVPATAGSGPGGGGAGSSANDNAAGNAGYAVPGPGILGGAAYGSVVLVPFVGGSGGGGAYNSSLCRPGLALACGNGGAGGGAIRIVSSVSIAITGIYNSIGIKANGGYGTTSTYQNLGGYGGNGSGGSIHLIAPQISGIGYVQALGGANASGAAGRILVQTNLGGFTSTTANWNPQPNVLTTVSVPPSLTGDPTLRITSVGGLAAPAYPTGDRLTPDVTLNASGPITIGIAASNIPIGTVIAVTLLFEAGTTPTTINCSPLAGILSSSTATCSTTLPQGVTIASVRASW